MTVKLRIRTLRENHPDKPSQRVMGDLLGIAESNYRKLETGYTQSITLKALDKLCKFFKCRPEDIFEYVED